MTRIKDLVTGECGTPKSDNPRVRVIRTFDTGATRDIDTNKPDYEGFLSPLVIQRFGEYMAKHRIQPDGLPRASDNWQKGIPADEYIKSAFRHFMAWWLRHRGVKADETLDEALCALLFNVQGYLHEHLRETNGPPPFRFTNDCSGTRPIIPDDFKIGIGGTSTCGTSMEDD